MSSPALVRRLVASAAVRWYASGMHVVLETERLILREFTTDDVDNLVELDGDPDVMLYVTGGRITTREEVEPELGYRLRKSAWGKGYAAEGSSALIRRGFTELGVRRVVAETMVVHTGSRRVMEKAGMRAVRTFHQAWPDPIPGDEHGDVEY